MFIYMRNGFRRHAMSAVLRYLHQRWISISGAIAFTSCSCCQEVDGYYWLLYQFLRAFLVRKGTPNPRVSIKFAFIRTNFLLLALKSEYSTDRLLLWSSIKVSNYQGYPQALSLFTNSKCMFWIVNLSLVCLIY